jgi:hypothetical protein
MTKTDDEYLRSILHSIRVNGAKEIGVELDADACRVLSAYIERLQADQEPATNVSLLPASIGRGGGGGGGGAMQFMEINPDTGEITRHFINVPGHCDTLVTTGPGGSGGHSGPDTR